MRKLSFLPPALALACGIIGFFLRSEQLNTIFDSSTGLAQTLAPVSVKLYILTGCITLCSLILALVIPAKYTPKYEYHSAFHMSSFIAFAVSSLLGMALSAAAVFHFVQLLPEFANMSSGGILVLVLSFLSGISVIITSVSAYTGKHIAGIKIASIIPCTFFCLRLLELYTENSANPVLLDFIFPCFACITASLSFFYNAGFAFGKSKIKFTIFFELLAIYFCTLSLADPLQESEKIFFILFLLIQIINSTCFFRNLSAKSADKI